MTIKYGEKKLTPEAAKQLNQIEAELRPQDLMQKLEAYVLAEAHGHIDIAVADAKDQSGAGIMAAWEQAHKIAEDIGRQFALQEELLAEALPRVLNAGHGRQWNFGRGLALEVEDVAAMWNAICAAFAGLDPKSRNISLIQGYLSGTVERDRAAASRFLDEALESPVLESQFPLLQAAIQIDAVGAARLSRAVSRGAAKAWTFRQLAYGRTADQIEPAAFKKLVLEIAKLPDGFPVAIDLLGMRLHILSTDKLTIDPETQSLGRELLISWSFTDYQDGNVDYHVSEVVRKCLAGSEGKSAAREFSENFVRALSSEGGDAWRFDHLANALFEIQPEIALDTFLGAKDRYGLPVLSRLAMLNDGIGPVNRVPSELLLGWASKDTSARFPWVAGEIRLLDKGPEHGDLQWTSSAIYLLENANERSAVLAAFSDHFEPRSWSGSLADVLTPYLQPIRALLTHSDPTVRDWARKWEGYLVERIAKERQQEQRIDASFE
jgi:hypothetical protein